MNPVFLPEAGSLPRSIEEAARCLSEAPELSFQQSWLEHPEPAFAPGTVRLACCENQLIVLANLADEHPFSTATEDHQRLWELGDVFEIFVNPLPGTRYREMHVNPNGLRLQLEFASEHDFQAVVAGRVSFDSKILREPCFDFQVRRTPKGWQVLAILPATLDDTSSTEAWLVNFGRYEASPGSQPVLSATAPLTKPSFHRKEEWHVLRRMKIGTP